MKPLYDKKGNFIIQIENENDWILISQVAEMMKSPGWSVLRDTFDLGLAAIEEAGMKGIETRTGKELSSEKWAQFKGYSQAVGLADNLVNQLKEQIKNNKENTSGNNDAAGD